MPRRNYYKLFVVQAVLLSATTSIIVMTCVIDVFHTSSRDHQILEQTRRV